MRNGFNCGDCDRPENDFSNDFTLGRFWLEITWNKNNATNKCVIYYITWCNVNTGMAKILTVYIVGIAFRYCQFKRFAICVIEY